MQKTMGCPLCAARAAALPRQPDTGGSYYHCGMCDTIALCRQQAPSAQQERKRYLEHDNSHANEGYVRMFEDFIRRAVLPFCDDGKALDFGCGPGPVLGDLLSRSGFDTDLYDPFFFPGCEHRSRSYDLITSTEVFEHLASPADVLDQLCGVLRPGGFLALMTHLHPGVHHFADWWYHRDPTHVTFYSRDTVDWISDNWPLDLVFSDGEKLITYRRVTG